MVVTIMSGSDPTRSTRSATNAGAPDAEACGSRAPVDHDSILDVLRTIDDPEMPINIVDLGIIADVRVSNGLDRGSSSEPAQFKATTHAAAHAPRRRPRVTKGRRFL